MPPVERLPAGADGSDPLVTAYRRSHAAVCAWRPVAWPMVLAGATAALAGGALAGALAPAGDGRLPPGLAWWFAHPGLVQAGMAAGAALVALAGRRRPVPAAQEPWWGAALAMAAHLALWDPALALGLGAALAAVVYLAAIGFRLLAVAAGGRPLPAPPPWPAERPWPVVSVLVPLYREREVAGGILAALAALDYPRDRLDVQLLLEADDHDTLAALAEAGVPPWIAVVVVPDAPPRTKPRACNHGLARARGELVVVYDAEDRPQPDQLRLAARAFAAAPPAVVCLQARLAYHNAGRNLLTRWFALEYRLWFGRYLAGLVRLGLPIPLGGTSNHFRTDALRRLGGWDPFNVTEDCDLGVRLHLAGGRTALLPSTTWEEAASRPGTWLRQRSRWLKGYLVTHLVWTRRPLHLLAVLGPWGTAGFLLSVGAVPLLALLNLGLWTATLVQGVQLGRDLAAGFPLGELLATRDWAQERHSWPVWYAGAGEDALLAPLSRVLCLASLVLLAGNLLFIALAVAAGRGGRERGLVAAALAVPAYWVLISLGALKGLADLVHRPHHWEKTSHGLDGPDVPPAPPG